MKLDSYQRTVLINQYELLRKLDPKDTHWTNAIEVFRNGYESEYSTYLASEAEGLSEEGAREVTDILSMFRALERAGSEEKFTGFDGNHPIEAKYGGFVSHLWSTRRFNESQHADIDGGNSHMEMLPIYKRMVVAWKNGNERARFPLTPEDVKRIEAAVHYPEG